MTEDLGDRTEEATPRRRQEARAEGKVARSHDLAGAVILLATTLVLWAACWPVLGQAKVVVAQALDGAFVSDPTSPDATRDALAYLGAATCRIILPLLLIAWAIAYLGHFLQVGWLFAPRALRPALSKLDPIGGFRRIFGTGAFVKAGTDTLKVGLVLAVAVLTIVQSAPDIVLLPQLPLLQALSSGGAILILLGLRVLAVLLLLGLLDYLYQRWRYARDLRMTKQQVREELKETEGDPEVKRRRLRMQHQLAFQRIGAAVPKADVVVTNPQHFAVAIRYDAETMRAPRVVAKGADLLAVRIRQIALRHAVPVIERKPLARALYRHVEVGQEIPPQFYQAVAEILAYVYRLNGKVA
jgi:flagellar biosynthetic protein FlhB